MKTPAQTINHSSASAPEPDNKQEQDAGKILFPDQLALALKQLDNAVFPEVVKQRMKQFKVERKGK